MCFTLNFENGDNDSVYLIVIESTAVRLNDTVYQSIQPGAMHTEEAQSCSSSVLRR